MRTVLLLAGVAGTVLAPLAAAQGIAATVGIEDFSYTPAAVSIQPGQTVAIAAAAFHPLAVDANAAIGCDVDCNVTFLTPGTYDFFCVNHGGPGGVGMAGTVTVTGAAGDWVFVGTMEHTVL
jgi:plastocyanin